MHTNNKRSSKSQCLDYSLWPYAVAGHLLQVYHITAPVCNYTPGITSGSLFVVGAITFSLMYEINKFAIGYINNLPHRINYFFVRIPLKFCAFVVSGLVMHQVLEALGTSSIVADALMASMHLCHVTLVTLIIVSFTLVLILLMGFLLFKIIRATATLVRGVVYLAQNIPLPNLHRPHLRFAW